VRTTQAYSDKRIKESLHSKNTGSKSSKLMVIIIALAIVAFFFALLYFVLFATLLPNRDHRE
jgi:ABC-type microcin C transport system permease subunit YejB